MSEPHDKFSPAKAINSHLKRWLTAIVAIPSFILLIGYGSPLLFACIIAIVSIIGAYEYGAIVFGEDGFTEKIILILAAPSIVMVSYCKNFSAIVAILLLAMITVFSLNILFASANKLDISRPMAVVFGIVYIPIALAHLVALRADGATWIFFVLVFSMLGDVFAFYIGSKWGRRKLAPVISPNKSVEGFVAIPFGALIGGSVFAYFFLTEIPFYHIAALAIFGSILGQIGDLCESMLKRVYGVKDSGTILPGHGGILDRLDCLVFTFPFVYYYKVFLIE